MTTIPASLPAKPASVSWPADTLSARPRGQISPATPAPPPKRPPGEDVIRPKSEDPDKIRKAGNFPLPMIKGTNISYRDVAPPNSLLGKALRGQLGAKRAPVGGWYNWRRSSSTKPSRNSRKRTRRPKAQQTVLKNFFASAAKGIVQGDLEALNRAGQSLASALMGASELLNAGMGALYDIFDRGKVGQSTIAWLKSAEKDLAVSLVVLTTGLDENKAKDFLGKFALMSKMREISQAGSDQERKAKVKEILGIDYDSAVAELNKRVKNIKMHGMAGELITAEI